MENYPSNGEQQGAFHQSNEDEYMPPPPPLNQGTEEPVDAHYMSELHNKLHGSDPSQSYHDPRQHYKQYQHAQPTQHQYYQQAEPRYISAQPDNFIPNVAEELREKLSQRQHSPSGADTIYTTKKLVTLYAYVGQEHDELSFSAGEILTYDGKSPEPGFICAVNRHGDRGLIPENYVEPKKQRAIPKIPQKVKQDSFEECDDLPQEEDNKEMSTPKGKSKKKVVKHESTIEQTTTPKKHRLKSKEVTPPNKPAQKKKASKQVTYEENDTEEEEVEEQDEDDVDEEEDEEDDEEEIPMKHKTGKKIMKRNTASQEKIKAQELKKTKKKATKYETTIEKPVPKKRGSKQTRDTITYEENDTEEEVEEEDEDDDVDEEEEEEEEEEEIPVKHKTEKKIRKKDTVSQENIKQDKNKTKRNTQKHEPIDVKPVPKKRGNKQTRDTITYEENDTEEEVEEEDDVDDEEEDDEEEEEVIEDVRPKTKSRGTMKKSNEDNVSSKWIERKGIYTNVQTGEATKRKPVDYVPQSSDRGNIKNKPVLPKSKGRGHFENLVNETGSVKKKGKSKEPKSNLGKLKAWWKRLTTSDGTNSDEESTKIVNGIQVYKFPLVETHRDEKNKIRKVTIGTMVTACAQKTILLVGATGSGKSTMLDGMINFIYGMAWEDNYRLSLVDLQDDEKHRVHKTIESQTDWITAYTIPKNQFSGVPFELTIVDMPGFGDTRGVQRDDELVKQLKKLFSSGGTNGIDAVNAVCFVAKAGDARLTATQRYIFNQILQIFGKNIKENIQVLISFADGKRPMVMDALKEAGVPFNKTFKFNNSALFSSVDSEDQQVEGGDPFTKIFWEMGIRSYTEFFDYLNHVPEQSLTLTAQVLAERSRLTIIISDLRKNIEKALVKINDHNKLEKDLEENKELMESNQNYEIVRTKDKLEKVYTKEGEFVIYCTVCNNACHEECCNGSAEECTAMDEDGNCEVCPKKCSYEHHESRDYFLKPTVIKIKTTLEEVKNTFLKAQKGTAKLKELLEPIRKERETLENDVKGMVGKVTECLKKLDKIALKKGHSSEIDYFNLLIEDEKQRCQPGYEGRITKLRELIEEQKTLDRITNENDVFGMAKESPV